MDATISKLVDEIGLVGDERGECLDALMCIPEEHGMRSLWLKPMRELVAHHAPEAVESYTRFASQFGFTTFGYAPVRSILLCLMRGASVCYPDLPLVEACNRLTRAGTALLANQTILLALLEACNENLAEFLKLSVQSSDIFFNYGDLSLERPEPDKIRVNYEGHSPFFLRHWAAGYHEGLLALFGLTGEVGLGDQDELDCTVCIQVDEG